MRHIHAAMRNSHAFRFHPLRRRRFQFGDQISHADRPRQTHCKVDMIGNTTYPKAFAFQVSSYGGKISVDILAAVFGDPRLAVFSAEDDMNEQKGE
jgi:hypothetical protein